jgi:Fur family ferric uptake transcriptional regulator
MDLQAVDAGLLQSRYRLTRQRASILRALGDGSHLSAEAVHERVRAEVPNVSLGTIYRTLEILRELGLVQMFSHAGHAALYERDLDKHHHLLCTRCSALTNVKSDAIAPIVAAIAAENGYAEVESSLTIVGHCAQCRTAG